MSLLLVFFFLLMVRPAGAWDETGHKLTAYIAWEQLSPAAREKIFSVLLAAPEDSDLNVMYSAFSSRSERAKRRELFMYASIWPDVVRNPDFKLRNGKYNRSDWHYGAIFWRQDNGRARVLENFPVESGKAIPKLYEFEQILRNASASPAEKAIALAWFLHVGADIHNPLHNASRVTDLEPEGDRGGNLFVLRDRTETQRGLNLHSYWDGIIGRVIPRRNDACDADYVAPIAKRIMRRYPLPKMRGRLDLGDYRAWNAEGFDLLDKVVYRDVRRSRLPAAGYRQRAFRVAERQIALAGYRVGLTLEQIFGAAAKKDPLPPPEVESSDTECRIIRRVPYPVSKRPTPEQTPRIALLDVCPPNRGMIARPMIRVLIREKPQLLEYDVIRVFENEAEAAAYARQNDLTYLSFN